MGRYVQQGIPCLCLPWLKPEAALNWGASRDIIDNSGNLICIAHLIPGMANKDSPKVHSLLLQPWPSPADMFIGLSPGGRGCDVGRHVQQSIPHLLSAVLRLPVTGGCWSQRHLMRQPSAAPPCACCTCTFCSWFRTPHRSPSQREGQMVSVTAHPKVKVSCQQHLAQPRMQSPPQSSSLSILRKGLTIYPTGNASFQQQQQLQQQLTQPRMQSLPRECRHSCIGAQQQHSSCQASGCGQSRQQAIQAQGSVSRGCLWQPASTGSRLSDYGQDNLPWAHTCGASSLLLWNLAPWACPCSASCMLCVAGNGCCMQVEEDQGDLHSAGCSMAASLLAKHLDYSHHFLV